MPPTPRGKSTMLLDSLVQDVRYTLRSMRRSPPFVLAAIVTLTLGIGVNTAVFSVVNAVLLRPLPVRDGDRLVVLASQRRSSGTLHGVSYPDLQDYRPATADVFEDVAGYSVGFAGLTPTGGAPARVLVTWVTGNYFPLLDIGPAAGRLIHANEGGPGRADPVVVLGQTAWQRRFGADPSIVGRTVLVNGRVCTIVGVAPPGFHGTFAFSDSELYLPMNWSGDEGLDVRAARGLHAIGRLRSGATLEKAQAVMSVVAERLARQYPDSNADLDVRVLPERLARPEEDQFRASSTVAAVVIAMVLLVMVVAAVNVTNLLLAKTAIRERELALRSALGAGRARLVRQMVTESLVLATIGGAAGVLLGAWMARAFATVRVPGDLPVRFDFGLDGTVLAYAAAVLSATGLLVGLAAAWRASRADPGRVLRGQSSGSSTASGRTVRGCLVIGQIACCFVLLAIGGLFARSLGEAERADLGFQPDGVLNVHMDAAHLGYTKARGRAFFDEVLRRVRSIPGVEHASYALTIPMGYIRVTTAVEADRGAGEGGPVFAGKNLVSPEYFDTMGIRLVRGRSFEPGDDQRGRPVAVVNEHLAELLWGGQDPIGRRFTPRGLDDQGIEVIGVTRTGKYRFLFEDPQPYFYVPLAQEYTDLRVLHVRASARADALAPAVERAIRALEPGLPLYDVQPMTRALGSGPGFFPVRMGAAAVGAFGLLALALAVAGLYGVTSYLAGRRTHEIGVRLALGATHAQILRLVLREGMTLVVFGLCAGLLVTALCSRIVERFLFGVTAHDPLTLATIVPVLGGAALLACALPAVRAARLDPTTSLREAGGD